MGSFCERLNTNRIVCVNGESVLFLSLASHGEPFFFVQYAVCPAANNLGTTTGSNWNFAPLYRVRQGVVFIQIGKIPLYFEF